MCSKIRKRFVNKTKAPSAHESQKFDEMIGSHTVIGSLLDRQLVNKQSIDEVLFSEYGC